ncbi:uncharacterized protein LOC129244383 [Anastrepha obliqua]|uniref:uncharacterized protein LOC129244383 n=1 Tax=Anastrepha obliqua TaxID=95512 RepID=UPI0024098385|nr:uncharacterized protein LOC129244383 [Anastrepha obliqua]
MQTFSSLQLLLAILFSSVISQLYAADDQAARETCVKQAKLNADELNRVKSESAVMKLVDDDSEALKCYQRCYYRQLGLMDDAGKAVVPLLVDFISKNTGVSDKKKITEVFLSCKSVKRDSECDKVYQIGKCIMQKLAV